MKPLSPQTRRSVKIVTLVLSAFLTLLMLHAWRQGHLSNKFGLHVGDPIPLTVFPILNQDNVTYDPHDWAGRPYLVNFFASWCTECRDEHEELMTLAAAHIPIVGITFKDKPAATNSYMQKSGNPFVAIATDVDGHSRDEWKIAGIPETFVIDRRGFIRWHHMGALTPKLVEEDLMPLWERVVSDKKTPPPS